ncbi:hypothetical protein HGRIS_009253 [Hohenbuehelia grisea]|uniref:CCR4-Not complex component Not N-terminal domain-containing protein n=1 Tax=Hohenbuehelia grisea TaxID=104357 RepID=A0ABR3J0K5_9AGAR
MEKFKACEKEMKTKAFSKEGLIQAAKLDPKEQEKEEATSWLQSQVEELQMQVEQSEAEIESLQGTGKKRNKGNSIAGRLEELEQLNERRKWHIGRLEIVLRLLNNGSLSPDKVFGLKDDVSYFVESNTEEDFDEDEGIYDELNLDEEEEKFGLVAEDDDGEDSDEASEVDLPPPPRTPSSKKQHDEESTSSSKQASSPVLKKAAVSLQLRKQSVDSKPPPALNFSQQPMSSIVKAGLPAVRPNATPIKYAAAAAAAVAPLPSASATAHPPPQTPSASSATASTSTQVPPSSAQNSSQDQQSVVPSSPSLTHPSVTSPMLSSAASVSQQPDGSFYSGQESPALSEAVPSSVGGPAASSSPQRAIPPDASPRVARAPSVAYSPVVSQSQPTQVNGSAQTQQPPAGPTPAAVGSSPMPPQAQTSQALPAPPGIAAIGSPLPQQQAQLLQGVKVPPSEQASSSQAGAQQPVGGGPRPPSSAQQAPQRTAATAFPGSLSDLVSSFEGVKQKGLQNEGCEPIGC